VPVGEAVARLERDAAGAAFSAAGRVPYAPAPELGGRLGGRRRVARM